MHFILILFPASRTCRQRSFGNKFSGGVGLLMGTSKMKLIVLSEYHWHLVWNGCNM